MNHDLNDVVIGKWPAEAICIMFFLLSKTVDSDKPKKRLETQIGWWERGRADIMQDPRKTKIQWNGMRQQKKQVDRNTQSGKRCWSQNRTKQRQFQKGPRSCANAN